MDIPRTLVAAPEWIAAQDPSHWLTSEELAGCLAPASSRRRVDRLAGRLALKRLLRQTFGVAPLSYVIGSDGPAPVLCRWPGPAGLTVSLSHSAGRGAASWAWEDGEGAVGVDVQHIRPAHPGLAARVLTEGERTQAADVLLFWALKEAAIKARRQPWGRALNEIVVTLGAERGAAGIVIPGEPPLAARYARRGDWWLARAVRRPPRPNPGEPERKGEARWGSPPARRPAP
jgi:phosphopantetheinyl transferase